MFCLKNISKTYHLPRVYILTFPNDVELLNKPTVEASPLQETSVFPNRDPRFLSIVAAFPLMWELICFSIATQGAVVHPKLARLCQIPEALLCKRKAPPLAMRRPYQSARLQKRKPLAALE